MTAPLDFASVFSLFSNSPPTTPTNARTSISIYKQLTIDTLNPIAVYLKLIQEEEEEEKASEEKEGKEGTTSFLFESVLGGEQIGRFSFIGVKPRKVMRNFEGRDPVRVVEEVLGGVRNLVVPGLDLPDFTGGAVGYISYDCIQHFEPTTKPKVTLKDPLGIPEAVLGIFDTIVIFDHLYNVIKVCSNVLIDSTKHKDENHCKMAYDLAVREILRVENILFDDTRRKGRGGFPRQEDVIGGGESVSNVGEQGYKDFVTEIKKHIVTGDVIQVVPSQRLKRKTTLHPFNAYRRLRSVNPSPYMFYLDLGDFQIVGASPEMLVKVEKGGKVFMHPIAGTRRRGKTQEEDEILAKDLLSDLKERSEHIMLVDLGRNDVNRVCDPQSVKVDSLMHIERYAHVMHIVSHVSGQLRKELTPFDAFRSIFPAGTVSGAPKVRAMQLIYELEKEKRGIYAGAVGYFGYSGGIDTCIAIRTMLFKDGHVYLQAGGGIVHDSDPDAEYLETINKLMSNVVAIEEAEKTYKEK